MRLVLKHVTLWMGLLLLTAAAHAVLPFLHVTIVYNSGLALGSFADSSTYFRLTGISVLAGIIFVVASFFYAYLPKQLQRIRWGITLLLTGISGNVIEKMVFGEVSDFIPFTLMGNGFFFNLNDLYQWIGAGIVAVEIFRRQDEIWSSFLSGQRRQLLLYRDLQLTILAKILGVSFLMSLTQAMLAVTLFFPRLGEIHLETKIVYLAAFCLVNVILLPLLGYFLLKELVRCVRPVYVLHQKLISEDHGTPLLLRKEDHFHHVAQSYNDHIDKIRKQSKN